MTVESLVGHGSLRVAVAGQKRRALTAREMDAMIGLLGDALDAGACGLSTGLMYAPGESAPFEELERLVVDVDLLECGLHLSHEETSTI